MSCNQVPFDLLAEIDFCALKSRNTSKMIGKDRVPFLEAFLGCFFYRPTYYTNVTLHTKKAPNFCHYVTHRDIENHFHVTSRHGHA